MMNLRHRKTNRLTLAAGTTMVVGASVATAQTVVYDNSTTSTAFYFGSAAAGAVNGNEVGENITLGGFDRAVSQIDLWMYNPSESPTFDLQVRLYNPGAVGTGPGGSALLWDSGVLAGRTITANMITQYSVPVPNISVPDTIIYTAQILNRSVSVAAMGPFIYNPPTVGSSADNFWGLDIVGFPGWVQLFFNGNPVANFGVRVTAVAGITGACCLPNGTCMALGVASCQGQGGAYQGDGVLCADVVCPQPGACCLIDGLCSLTSATACANFSGSIYRGNGSACASANCPPGPPTTLYTNGTLVTGTTSASGVPAPAGTQWSEVPADACGTLVNNGFAVVDSALPGNRIADNFTITDPLGWNVGALVFYAYQTNTTATASPFTSATIQIWNGPPGGGGTVVFGDTTTNRLGVTKFSNIYRCPNTQVPPPGVAPTTARPVYENWFNVGTTLPPGSYWIDVQFHAAPTNAGFAPSNTLVGSRTTPGADALQLSQTGSWASVTDPSNPASCGLTQQDFPFVLKGAIVGAPSPCYPNCDHSTIIPCLNVQDFTCFLNKFASQDTYANCDNSTIVPVLNVQDFTCFLNKFASGCSSC